MATPTPPLHLERLEDELALAFDYHPALVSAIKRLPVRTFDRASRRWHVPLRFAPELAVHLEAAGAPDDWLEQIRPHAQDALAQTALHQARRLAPAPGQYPGLFPHQQDGLAFLLAPRPTRGAILADEMGLGKTRQAILAAHAGHPQGEILVVCPAAIKLNWAREIALALGPGEDVHVVKGGDLRRARWTIVNYDLLTRHREALGAERWACLILDEAHAIKNLKTRRTSMILGGASGPTRVSGLADRADRVLCLTGTPITNRPLDLFPLLRAVGHPIGDDLPVFGMRYCAGHRHEFGWDYSGASHLDELHARLEPTLLRRRREEVLALPPKLRTYMPVEVDLVSYRQVWKDYVARLATQKRRGRRIPKRFLLAEIAKLRHAAALAKIEAARALIASILEQGEKVVVFTHYQKVVQALMSHFGPTAVRVTGRDDTEARQKAVDAFQHDPAVRVFVGNLKAAGTGVSLTAAAQVVFVDYAFVPADHLQAEDRPCRIGQRHAVTVTYLSAQETIDEEIEALLAQKLAVVSEAIDGVPGTLATSFVDDLLAILAPPQPPV